MVDVEEKQDRYDEFLKPRQTLQKESNLTKVLKEAKPAKNSAQNLYQHIIDVVDTLALNCPDRAIQRFEEVSYLLKNKDRHALAEFVRVAETKDYATHDASVADGTQDLIQQLKNLLHSEEVANNDDETKELTAINHVPDLISLNKNVFNWAGHDFGEQATLVLQKSLKELIQKSSANFLRFWGKITGTEQDYWIVEGQAPVSEEEGGNRPEDFEARGTGVNQFSYWVANSPMGPWTQLDDLEPRDLEEARGIKVHFTGDLNRNIVTNPFYFKTEKTYLRAQIARITQTTKLVPAGVYKKKEEEPLEIEEDIPEDDENQRTRVPTTAQMCSKSNWVHYAQNILKCNRLVHPEPNPETDIPEGKEIEDVKKEIAERDPYEPRLKPITQDTSCTGGYPAWTLRAYGDQMIYSPANPAHPKENYGVVIVRSTVWPGAFSYFWQGRWGEVYVGDGQKHDERVFFPVNPPAIMHDPQDKPACPEPNPTQEFLDAQAAKAAAAEAAAAGGNEDE